MKEGMRKRRYIPASYGAFHARSHHRAAQVLNLLCGMLLARIAITDGHILGAAAQTPAAIPKNVPAAILGVFLNDPLFHGFVLLRRSTAAHANASRININTFTISINTFTPNLLSPSIQGSAALLPRSPVSKPPRSLAGYLLCRETSKCH